MSAVLSEFELIGRYFTPAAPTHLPPGTLGVGDDCALFSLPAGSQLATSTDLLVEGRHFFAEVDAQALGHKALAVNLSDLAAMGAQPVGCLLGLALPAARARDDVWLAGFARGFTTLAQRHGCPLLGGDTTRSDTALTISVTVFGTLPAGGALRRDAARAGEDIWVSGDLGAPAAALGLLQGRWQNDLEAAERAAQLVALRGALERPEPPLALAVRLRGIARAAIDISDGLLQDLGHILSASGCGALLYEPRLPIAPALAGWPSERTRALALGGGDVYQICFTAPRAARETVHAAGAASGTRLTRIGHTTRAPGLTVLDAQNQPLADLPDGFDHFRA